MRRADGVLHPATWDEALGLGRRPACARVQAEHGPDAVGVFGGGGLTNEKAYQLGKFARVALRTRHIDYNGRFCMSSAAAAGNRAFGIDRGLPFPVEDLGGAGAVLLLGQQRRRHHAAVRAAPRPASAGAAAWSSSTRAARRPPR